MRGVEENRGLWGRAFRPFFLIMSMYAALAVPLWAATWIGILPATAWLTPSWWHGHEMIFGFVASAIAGFLLTASPVWTGGRALSGPALFALVILWLAGKLRGIDLIVGTDGESLRRSTSKTASFSKTSRKPAFSSSPW